MPGPDRLAEILAALARIEAVLGELAMQVATMNQRLSRGEREARGLGLERTERKP